MSDAGAEVDFWLSVKASLDTVADQVTAIRRKQQDAADRMGTDLTIVQSITATATASPSFFMGTPSQGRKWYLRRIMILGTTSISNYKIYISSVDPGVNPILTDLTWEGTSAPFCETFSNSQIIVHPGTNLYVVASGMTAGDVYNVNMQVEDWPDRPHSVTDTFIQ